MEAERLASADRTLAPNRFVVHLNPTDLAGFGDMTGSLATELADGALLFARTRKYTLVDRPRVDLLGDPTVERNAVLLRELTGLPVWGPTWFEPDARLRPGRIAETLAAAGDRLTPRGGRP